MRNTFGNIMTLTTFGESHGIAIGGVIDGFPAGIEIDLDKVQWQLDRRRPGQSHVVSGRNECDKVEILSGMYEGTTLGSPIGFIIRNHAQRGADYDDMKRIFRPSHADFTTHAKYGLRDHRGAGRSSARETACRVVAGAFAMQALDKLGISVTAYCSQIGTIKLEESYEKLDLSLIGKNDVRCPDADMAMLMLQMLADAKAQGDTLGGVVSCVIKGVPAGVGEPVYGKLSATLASAMMSINAAKGFELGAGFDMARRKGSEVLDVFVSKNGKISTTTNYSGGIQGGMSNGQDICFNVAFKPVATLFQDVLTVDLDGKPITFHAKGRHDACVVPRAVPVVESMAAIVVLDQYLCNKTVHLC